MSHDRSPLTASAVRVRGVRAESRIEHRKPLEIDAWVTKSTF